MTEGEHTDTVWLDAARVQDALDLPGEPLGVSITGRNIGFKFPTGSAEPEPVSGDGDRYPTGVTLTFTDRNIGEGEELTPEYVSEVLDQNPEFALESFTVRVMGEDGDGGEDPEVMTDGGEPDPRIPVTLRDDAHADVYETERCDGAGSDGCVREDPELTRGEDEIHVTNYGPGHSESGRRVLCGTCHDKQTALNIADDPELAALYQDELAGLRERFPDILGDVDLPVTDGGEDWTEQYATTTYRGPQQYPVPGAWALGIVEADGIGWKHYPDAGEGASHDSDVMDAMDPDEYREGPDARASLMSEYPEDADVREDPPYHELKVDGEVVLILKDASEVDETEWWSAIAEALARYDSGGEYETVLSDMGLEHLKADPFGAGEDADDDGEDVDRSLDEFATDGGTEQVVTSKGANGNSKRFHRDRGDGRPDCRYGKKENLDWTDKTVSAIYAFYSPCPFCYPNGHDEYQRLTGNSEDRVLTDGGGA